MALNAVEKGELEPSEFSWGPGSHANANGPTMPAAPGYNGGPPPLTASDRLRAVHATDPANPDANEDDVFSPNVTQSGTNEDGTYRPGTLDVGITKPVRVGPGLPRSGPNARIDPARYNPGHYPDGLQDGEGQAWRDSVGH